MSSAAYIWSDLNYQDIKGRLSGKSSSSHCKTLDLIMINFHLWLYELVLDCSAEEEPERSN